ncbi:MAG: hypothetical protein IJU69_05655 [Bacteroidales bacterium]|nr:hypothetical protein [Bacteroidales bacterium]
MANKITLLTISAVLFTLALASCNKENSRSQGDMEIIDGALMSFSAEVDESLTKAYANASTGAVSWENGDRIMVSNGATDAQEFEYNSTKKAVREYYRERRQGQRRRLRNDIPRIHLYQR